jgi:SAM-dependent methyltransferase
VRRRLGPEAAKNLQRRLREGFFDTYLSGEAVLDIGFKGELANAEPVTERAIGIDLDYPGYDGKRLPFPDASQDAVFASHVLEHIADYSSVIYDWYRVLKITGYLVIAVPHRDLYERKANPPSRFNADHKRFYTPASLLTEIEEALPVGGFRVRSLKDVDEGFDYGVPPNHHAFGSYEIELVLQKIAIPQYAQMLRPSPLAGKLVAFYADLLGKALDAERHARTSEVAEIQTLLSGLPLPPYATLLAAVERRNMGTPIEADTHVKKIQKILRPLVRTAFFDQTWYISQYEDIAKLVTEEAAFSPHCHYINYGYFEGRLGSPQ